MKNKNRVLTQLGLAQSYVMDGDVERAERACDTAIRFMYDMGPCGLTLRELNAACDAFLEKTGFPTLAVAVVYIEHWRRKDTEWEKVAGKLQSGKFQIELSRGDSWVRIGDGYADPDEARKLAEALLPDPGVRYRILDEAGNTVAINEQD